MSNPAPAITPYGDRSPRAPAELDTFAFLVGKWNGVGRTTAPDGSPVQFEMTWVGRYVLDGMAIADEFHGTTPDGKPYLGISLRQYDSARGTWVVEFLNVTGSFVRRQVNAQSGAVRHEGDAVIVISEDGETRIRETYRVSGRDQFTYAMELSQDAGKTWAQPPFELSLTRAE